MFFDDSSKNGQLVLSKEYSHKLYISSNFAYLTAFVAMFNGYFLNYWVWMYNGVASNWYWQRPTYGGRRNLDITLSLLNIGVHSALINYNVYGCKSYYLPTFLFYMGTSSYFNALLFGRFFKSESISSCFHLCFHIFMNGCAISLYTC